MNARTMLLTATALIALAGPASAGATLPADNWWVSNSLSKTHALHQVKGSSHSSRTVIRVGAYNAHAYVQGGASHKVAKAITAAGKKTAHARARQTRTPAPASAGGVQEPCSVANACTDLQQCELWNDACALVEPVSPASVVVSTDAVLPAETPAAVESGYPVPPATDQPAGAGSTYDVNQDC